MKGSGHLRPAPGPRCPASQRQASCLMGRSVTSHSWTLGPHKRKKGTETETERQGQREKQTDRQRKRDRETERDRVGKTETETERERDADTEREEETERETGRHRAGGHQKTRTHTETHRRGRTDRPKKKKKTQTVAICVFLLVPKAWLHLRRQLLMVPGPGPWQPQSLEGEAITGPLGWTLQGSRTGAGPGVFSCPCRMPLGLLHLQPTLSCSLSVTHSARAPSLPSLALGRLVLITGDSSCKSSFPANRSFHSQTNDHPPAGRDRPVPSRPSPQDHSPGRTAATPPAPAQSLCHGHRAHQQ